MTAAEALRRLLRGTGLVAVAAGPSVFRLQPAPKPIAARRHQLPPSHPASVEQKLQPSVSPGDPDIVVTGQKRTQALRDVPMSLSVVTFGPQSATLHLGSQDVALLVDGLTLTNLGPGRNRQFIRGVADSPFIGPSQSTVAVELDEARVTFDAPDPDLRLVDIERVEILKGPQGPLYGSGALGGLYHIVTKKPELGSALASASVSVETVAHGGPGLGGEAVLNLPIVTGSFGLRAVGYASHEGGWIDDLGRKADANVTRSYGGRLAIRWRPASEWTIDLAGAAQNVNVGDSQYVTASRRTLRRLSPIPEPADNDFRMATATVEGRVGDLKAFAATSYVDQLIDFTLDASASAPLLGTAAPAIFRDDRGYSVFNQEFRLSPADGGRWLAGVSFLRATSHSAASLYDPAGMASRQVEALHRVIREYAVFGEATLPLWRKVNAIAGLRLFRTIAEDEAIENEAGTADTVGKTILSPSLALSWLPDPRNSLYLRYARAVRPGGLAPTGQTPSRRFDADQLGTLEVGFRHGSAAGRLSYSASLFRTEWNDIQSDYLLPNGLVSTHNIGRAVIQGGEASIEWTMLPKMHLSGGLGVQPARLTHSTAGVEVDDRRLPVVPDLTARLALRQDFTLSGWQSVLNAQVNYVGPARLSFDPEIDRLMGEYALVSGAASFTRDGVTVTLRIDNLLDTRGDSFSFGNAFSIRTTQQYTPLRPRTFTLSIGRSW